jgi:hypothetical protein
MIWRTHSAAIVLVADIGSSTFTTRPVVDRGDGQSADDQIDAGGDLSTLNRFVLLDPSWDSEDRQGDDLRRSRIVHSRCDGCGWSAGAASRVGPRRSLAAGLLFA